MSSEESPPSKTRVAQIDLRDAEDDEQEQSIPYLQRAHNDLVREMNETILFQELAIDQLSVLLRTLCRSPLKDTSTSASVRERIHKRLLSGPSGVGKTESVRLVQRLLGMAPGGRHERQFVYVDGSEYQDVTQINRLLGAGPGYMNCDSDNTVVDALLRAAERSPPLIVLFIDEVDKTHLLFMSVINGLLDQGEISSARGVFTLPADSQLLVLFTSNFGHAAITAEMQEVQDHHTAVQYVERAMRERGLAPNSIERFGSHIIFYPIGRGAMRRVIEKKITELLQRPCELTARYGAVECTSGGSTMTCLIDLVLSMTDPERGIRNAIKHVSDALTPLLLDVFYKLEEEEEQDSSGSKRKPRLSLVSRVIHLSVMPDAVIAIDNNVVNRKRLEVYRAAHIDTVPLLGVSLHREATGGGGSGGEMISCMVLPCYRPLEKLSTGGSDSTLDDEEEQERVTLIENQRISPLKRPAVDEPSPPQPPEKRQCGVCGRVKPIVDFEREARDADGEKKTVRSKSLCNRCVVIKQSNK